MTATQNRTLLSLALVLGVALALAASGCLWGVVRDAETGVGVPGATVTYTDSAGKTSSTTTGEGGLYAFDVASCPVPAAGAVNFLVTATGYDSLTETRLVEYNDNPEATEENLSSYWEVQRFDLEPGPTPTPERPRPRIPSSGGG